MTDAGRCKLPGLSSLSKFVLAKIAKINKTDLVLGLCDIHIYYVLLK